MFGRFIRNFIRDNMLAGWNEGVAAIATAAADKGQPVNLAELQLSAATGDVKSLPAKEEEEETTAVAGGKKRK